IQGADTGSTASAVVPSEEPAVVGEHSTAGDRGGAPSVTKGGGTVENTDARKKPPLEAPAAAPASEEIEAEGWDRILASELAAKELAAAGKRATAVDRGPRAR